MSEEINDTMAEAASKDAARHAAQEAEPLRTFCVTLKDASSAYTISAHRIDDGAVVYSFMLSAMTPKSTWIRFIVYRNGRHDVVAMFREAEVDSVYQLGEVSE